MREPRNGLTAISKITLWVGLVIFGFSMCLPSIRTGLPFHGEENLPGIVAFVGSPLFAIWCVPLLCYCYLLAAFFGVTLFLCNVVAVYSIALRRRLLVGDRLRLLPLIILLSILVWCCPRRGIAKLPELLGGYYVWAFGVSLIGVSLVLAAAAHLHEYHVESHNPRKGPRPWRI